MSADRFLETYREVASVVYPGEGEWFYEFRDGKLYDLDAPKDDPRIERYTVWIKR